MGIQMKEAALLESLSLCPSWETRFKRQLRATGDSKSQSVQVSRQGWSGHQEKET